MSKYRKRKGSIRKAHEVELNSLIRAVNYGYGTDENFYGLGTLKHHIDGGNLVTTMVDDSDCLQTVDGYSLPLRVDVTVSTCGGELRLYYLMGALLFNHIHEVNGKKPFLCSDVISGVGALFSDKPNIPSNKFVDISWVLETDYVEVYVDGELYYRQENMPYMTALRQTPDIGKLLAPVRISAANDSTITIQSLTVTELPSCNKSAHEALVALEKNTPRHVYEVDTTTMTKWNCTNISYADGCMNITAEPHDDGIYTGMNSERWFNGAVKIDLRAKTNGGLCIFYHYGALLLNRGQNSDELFILDITNSKEHGYSAGGWLPADEFVDIEWIIGHDVMAVKVNGELRHVGDSYDYIGTLASNPDYELCAPVRVNATFGSTVTVESLRVTEL